MPDYNIDLPIDDTGDFDDAFFNDPQSFQQELKSLNAEIIALKKEYLREFKDRVENFKRNRPVQSQFVESKLSEDQRKLLEYLKSNTENVPDKGDIFSSYQSMIGGHMNVAKLRQRQQRNMEAFNLELTEDQKREIYSERETSENEKLQNFLKGRDAFEGIKLPKKQGFTTRLYATDAGQLVSDKGLAAAGIKDLSKLRYIDLPNDAARAIAPGGISPNIPDFIQESLKTIVSEPPSIDDSGSDIPIDPDELDEAFDPESISKSRVKTYLRELLSISGQRVSEQAGKEIEQSRSKVKTASDEAKKRMDAILKVSKANARQVSVDASAQRSAMFTVGQALGQGGYQFATIFDSFFSRPEEEAQRKQETDLQNQVKSEERVRLEVIQKREGSVQSAIKANKAETMKKIKSFFIDTIDANVDAIDEALEESLLESFKGLRDKSPEEIVSGISDIFKKNNLKTPSTDDLLNSIFGTPVDATIVNGGGNGGGVPPIVTPPPSRVPGGKINPSTLVGITLGLKGLQAVGDYGEGLVRSIGDLATAGDSPTQQTGSTNAIFKKTMDPIGINPVIRIGTAMLDVVAKIEENTRKEAPFTTPMTLMQEALNNVELLVRRFEEGQRRDPILSVLTEIRGDIAQELEGLKTNILEIFGPFQQIALTMSSLSLAGLNDILDSVLGKMAARFTLGGPLGIAVAGIIDAINQNKTKNMNNALLKEMQEFLSPEAFMRDIQLPAKAGGKKI